MRTLLKRIGTALLFLVVAICLAPTLVPPFLDRIYYQGPKSGHFDGQRFFNPSSTTVPERPRNPSSFFNRWLTAKDRVPWPDHVAVTQGYPPAQATLCAPTKGAIVENWKRCVDRVDPDLMAVTWIGHSTVLVQTAGLNILTDPIWSQRASPFSFVGPKRVREPGIRFDDLPKIDLVLVSHNHYDHMDLPTLKALWQRDRPLIVTSLGNDTILRKNGIDAVALDWGGRKEIGRGASVIVERNQHWGSRWGVDRNRALWSAFTVVLPGGNLFFGGDTGWGDGSWPREAARHGPFRFAIIPIGAYQPRDVMSPSHIGPDEALKIFQILNPTKALGVHWGTFRLSWEGINDPPQRLAADMKQAGVAPDRFVTTEVGRSFSVPPLPQAR